MMLTDAGTRLVTVLLSIGLAAGASGCAASTGGSASRGPTAASGPATTQPTTQAPDAATSPASVTSAPPTVAVAVPPPPTSAAAVPPPSTSTATSTSPGTTLAASPAATGSPADVTRVSGSPGIFVGVWNGHGRQLAVTAGGSAKVSYRVYKWCSDDPTPPCDLMKGNLIYEGGHITFHVVRVVTAHHTSTATANVLASTDPRFRPGSSQRLVLTGDVVTWAGFGIFCDEKASRASVCGA